MTCESCKTSYAPHDLAGGRCLGCLHKENTTLRLMMGQLIHHIQGGILVENNEGVQVLTQQFPAEFITEIQRRLSAVNIVTSENKKSDKPETQVITKEEVGPLPPGIV